MSSPTSALCKQYVNTHWSIHLQAEHFRVNEASIESVQHFHHTLCTLYVLVQTLLFCILIIKSTMNADQQVKIVCKHWNLSYCLIHSFSEKIELGAVYLPWAICNGLWGRLLMNVYFEKHLEEPLHELRARLNLTSPPLGSLNTTWHLVIMLVVLFGWEHSVLSPCCSCAVSNHNKIKFSLQWCFKTASWCSTYMQVCFVNV